MRKNKNFSILALFVFALVMINGALVTSNKSTASTTSLKYENDLSQQASEEPAQPQEPEKQEVEYIMIPGEREPITCQSGRIEACGVVLQRCSNGVNYYCLQGLVTQYRMETPKFDQ